MTVLLSSHIHFAGASKIRISRVDDLPRHTYRISTDIAGLMGSSRAFDDLCATVRSDIEHDLESYIIEDRTTLQELYGVLMMLDVFDGQYLTALEQIQLMRSIEEKAAYRLTIGLVNEALIHSRLVADSGTGEYIEVFVENLSGALNELPWETVQQRIEELCGGYEIQSENFLIGILESEYGEAVRETGQLGNDAAFRVIRYQYIIRYHLPLKEQILAVLSEHIAQHKVEKPDIWHERNVHLAEIEDLTPVVIAIWDSGVDTALFMDRLFVNRAELFNDHDDDANGFVDDIHGIAYTFEEEKTTDMLYPVDASPAELAQMKAMTKGLFDVLAGVDSQEARSLRRYMADLQPQDVGPFMEELAIFANYNHGTHTAGIAVQGNPAARILIARFTIDHRVPPPVPTIERAQKAARSYRETITYFKDHNVRVVNMSWGGTLRGTEEDLELNGVGVDAEDRAKLARRLFDIESDALYEAIRNAPDILFVCAAGNENDDVAFEEYFPASFDLPNVIAVGAVDHAGDETSFTSFGERVRVYANGYEVESVIVGGDTIAVSGTSVAAPQVTNLAAKLLAVDPSLSVRDVVRLIIDGADKNPEGRLLCINPVRSFVMMERQ